jgi:hypothetical protein
VCDLQQRQGERPSGPTKSAAVATRAGDVDVEFVEFEDGGAVVAGGADVTAAAAAAAVRCEGRSERQRLSNCNAAQVSV